MHGMGNQWCGQQGWVVNSDDTTFVVLKDSDPSSAKGTCRLFYHFKCTLVPGPEQSKYSYGIYIFKKIFLKISLILIVYSYLPLFDSITSPIVSRVGFVNYMWWFFFISAK